MSEIDPSNTASLRGRLSSRWRGAYGKINSQLEEDIVTRDVFGTRIEGTEQLAPNVPAEEDVGGNYDPRSVSPLAYASTSEKVRRFREWLNRQQEDGIRGRLSRQQNWYLTSAYNTGVRRAEQSLRAADYDIESVPPEDVPRRSQTLDQARSRFDDRLTKAFQDTTAETGQALQEGLSQGLAATVLFERVRDRINHSQAGKTRARPVAHGEIVRTANGAGLDRYQQAGAQEVSAQIEVRVGGPNEGVPDDVSRKDVEPPDEQLGHWATAGDSRVCPQCVTLEGQSWRISDIRSGTSPMPVRDTHGGCRCWLTVEPLS